MSEFIPTPHSTFAELVAGLFGGSSSNSIARGVGFSVSYNPGTDTGAETALIDGSRDKYLILNGDYRAEYAALIPQGYNACKEFFLAQPESQRSSWSNKP